MLLGGRAHDGTRCPQCGNRPSQHALPIWPATHALLVLLRRRRCSRRRLRRDMRLDGQHKKGTDPKMWIDGIISKGTKIRIAIQYYSATLRVMKRASQRLCDCAPQSFAQFRVCQTFWLYPAPFDHSVPTQARKKTKRVKNEYNMIKTRDKK